MNIKLNSQSTQLMRCTAMKKVNLVLFDAFDMEKSQQLTFAPHTLIPFFPLPFHVIVICVIRNKYRKQVLQHSRFNSIQRV